MPSIYVPYILDIGSAIGSGNWEGLRVEKAVRPPRKKIVELRKSRCFPAGASTTIYSKVYNIILTYIIYSTLL